MKNNQRRSKWFLSLLLAATLGSATGCSDPVTDPEDRRGESAITISADVSPSTAGLSVEITASDINPPIVQNIGVVGSVATGTVMIPAGSDRVLTVRAFDRNAIETHRGSATVNVEPSTNLEVTLTLDPLLGGQPIVVNAATYTVQLTPLDVAVDITQIVQFSATVTDAAGPVASPSLIWGALNPVVASIDQTGRAVPGTPGTTDIVASYRGIATATRMTVLGAETERIAFMSNRDGNNNIYTMTPSGTGLRQLTSSTADDFAPIWSPDGSRIAFVRSNVSGGSDVLVMNADGTGVVNLSNDPGFDTGPAWSRDGSRLAFVSNRAGGRDIFLVNVDGSGLTNLTSSYSPVSEQPAWSPDGMSIAFTSEGSPPPRLLAVAAVDGTAIQTIANTDLVTRPTWSPDGTSIRFASNGDLHSVRPDGAGLTNITNGSGIYSSPTWSPNGRWVAANRNDITGTRRDVVVMAENGTGIVTLTDEPNVLASFPPQWSRDGNRLVFVLQEPGTSDMDIYQANRDGSGLMRLTTDAADDQWPSWSPVAFPATSAAAAASRR